MKFHSFGPKGAPTVLLIPGLGVTFEVFTPLIDLLQERFHTIAVEVDGFVIGEHTHFTSIEDQATQVANHILSHHGGHIDCAYGLSLGGKILSHTLERGDITIDHAILDAAPLLPLPRIIVGPLSNLQALNVWTCYHWTGFWRRVFRSHYFDTLLDECKKAYPWGGRRAVIDGYKAVYTTKLTSIIGNDIHYWYGTKEAFVAKAQARHLMALNANTRITIFPKKNHGELLIDHPEEVAKRITRLIIPTP